MPLSFHVCDIALAKEWIGSCNEYLGFVKSPFSKVGFKQMWSPSQSNWEDAFQTWSVVQFLWAVIINIIAALLMITAAGEDWIVAAIRNFVISTLCAYLYAHMGWFGAIKKTAA